MYLTEIENCLSNDTDGGWREFLLDRLAEIRAEFAAQLAMPLAPADFRHALARVDACDAANSVINTLARRFDES
ncbi:type III secretion system (T3SS) needle YscE family protein [Paraburkholderia sp. BL8N3]|nr:EscE/YscE/SsaE family type III secretion system needle protein co-chaperone [Paraburkholderia sp. BL8N3]TCK31993.1 type III secretion system (T3SS) needle YscE family protein [Paraburkholderia sp. BL8N3]